jgi:Protein of unknown function (DUF3237)
MRKVGAWQLCERAKSAPVQNRLFLAVMGVAFAACVVLGQTTPQGPSAPNFPIQRLAVTELKSRHLFTITLKLPPALELGDTPAGNRRVFTVSGGQFTGDRLRGEVLPQAILMTYRGVRYARPEVSARIARGERVAPSDYYLRTTPFFETSAPKYAWLNKIVSVGIGERQPDGVSYEVFEIL